MDDSLESIVQRTLQHSPPPSSPPPHVPWWYWPVNFLSGFGLAGTQVPYTPPDTEYPGLFPLYGFFSGMITAAFTRLNAGLRGGSRSTQFPFRLWNGIWQHPAVVSGIVALGSGGAFFGWGASLRAVDELPVGPLAYIAGTKGLLAGAVTYPLTTLLGRAVHTDVLNTAYHRIAGKLRRKHRLTHLERIALLPHSAGKDATLELERAEELFFHGDRPTALQHYVAAIRASAAQKTTQGMADGLVPSPDGIIKRKYAIDRYTDTLAAYLRQGTRAFFAGDYAEADRFFHALLGDPILAYRRLPHLAHARFLQALALQFPEQREEYLDTADLEFRIYTSKLLGDASVEWQRFGEARNEVLLAQASDWDVARDVVIKRSREEKDISEEYVTTAVFHRVFGDAVTNPIQMLEQDGYYHLVMETAGHETLLDIVKAKRHLPEDFYNGARLLGRLHAFGLAHSEELRAERPADEQAYYTNRIADVLFRQSAASLDIDFAGTDRAVIDAYGVINDVLHEAPVTFYKDANLRNLMRGQHITAIDFERPRLLPGQLDLVNLFEFQYDYLTERQKRKAIKAYLKAANVPKAERSAFYNHYAFAAVQRHLELIGYRARDAAGTDGQQRQENVDAMTFHYRKALAHLERIVRKNLAGDRTAEVRALKQRLREVSPFNELAEPKASRVVETLDDKLASWRVRVGLAAATSLLVAAPLLGIKSYQERRVPLLDIPLISSSRTIWFAEETPDYRYLLFSADEHGRVERVADVTRQPFITPSISLSPRRDKVLYTANEGIVLHDARSVTSSVQLPYTFSSRRNSLITDVSFSPDGLRMFYVTGEYITRSKKSTITRFDNKAPDRIFQIHENANLSSPLWSPDSKQLLFALTPDDSLVYIKVIDALGSHAIQGPVTGYISPEPFTWSPDSSKIAYANTLHLFTFDDKHGTDIYVADRRFRDKKLVHTFPSSERVVSLAWAAPDTLVAFLTDHSVYPQPSHDRLVRLDDGIATEILAGNLGSFTLTPDYHTLVFGCEGDLCAYTPSTGTLRQFTATPESDEFPQYFVDSSTLAFTAWKESGSAVGIVNLNGTGYRLLTPFSWRNRIFPDTPN